MKPADQLDDDKGDDEADRRQDYAREQPVGAPLLGEQYKGPNPLVSTYVVIVAVNGYQSIVSEAEIDPGYGNQRVLVSLVEDGKPMAQAPYAST